MVLFKDLSPEWIEGHCVRDWFAYFWDTELYEAEWSCLVDVFIAHHRGYIDMFESEEV